MTLTPEAKDRFQRIIEADLRDGTNLVFELVEVRPVPLWTRFVDKLHHLVDNEFKPHKGTALFSCYTQTTDDEKKLQDIDDREMLEGDKYSIKYPIAITVGR